MVRVGKCWESAEGVWIAENKPIGESARVLRFDRNHLENWRKKLCAIWQQRTGHLDFLSSALKTNTIKKEIEIEIDGKIRSAGVPALRLVISLIVSTIYYKVGQKPYIFSVLYLVYLPYGIYLIIYSIYLTVSSL